MKSLFRVAEEARKVLDTTRGLLFHGMEFIDALSAGRLSAAWRRNWSSFPASFCIVWLEANIASSVAFNQRFVPRFNFGHALNGFTIIIASN